MPFEITGDDTTETTAAQYSTHCIRHGLFPMLDGHGRFFRISIKIWWTNFLVDVFIVAVFTVDHFTEDFFFSWTFFRERYLLNSETVVVALLHKSVKYPRAPMCHQKRPLIITCGNVPTTVLFL